MTKGRGRNEDMRSDMRGGRWMEKSYKKKEEMREVGGGR